MNLKSFFKSTESASAFKKDPQYICVHIKILEALFCVVLTWFKSAHNLLCANQC